MASLTIVALGSSDKDNTGAHLTTSTTLCRFQTCTTKGSRQRSVSTYIMSRRDRPAEVDAAFF
jgi:hypothetical protein